MLREVRLGHDVFGIFYGHPGVLTIPAHRALTLARQEGYQAKMLPGVSAIDYMFSDLELEPGQHGCTIHEATDLLARNRRLEPSAHNIILQPSSVGSATLEKEVNVSRILYLGPSHDLEHLTDFEVPAARRSPCSGFRARAQSRSLLWGGPPSVVKRHGRVYA